MVAQAYDWAERTVGPPLEAGVRTDTFADVLAATMKIRAELDRRRLEIMGQLSTISARWLHLINLPAADDVARLRAEILRLDRQCGTLPGSWIRRAGRGSRWTAGGSPAEDWLGSSLTSTPGRSYP